MDEEIVNNLVDSSDTDEAIPHEILSIRRLYAAILENAAHDLKLGMSSPTHHVDRLRAIDWFLDKKEDEIVTFQYCCDALGLDRKSVVIALRKQNLLPFKNPLQNGLCISCRFLGTRRDLSLRVFFVDFSEGPHACMG